MADLKTDIADVLRGRILRGVYGGALRGGDRLPSTRELAEEFGTDHRIVLAAYRALAEEGLVELRQRGGIYIAAGGAPNQVPLPSSTWIADVLAQGVAREIPLPDLHQWMRGAVETLRLRVVAIQATGDQLTGLCRELQEDYGLEAVGLDVAASSADPAPPELRAADLVITTPGPEPVVAPIAARLGKPIIVVDIRPDLIAGEWGLLLGRPIYVVVQDERFVPVIHEFFADTRGAENIRPLVLGRDDLGSIPADALVYVTRSARAQLGNDTIRGRILPSVRLFSADSSREIIRFIVSANLQAMATRRGSGGGSI